MPLVLKGDTVIHGKTIIKINSEPKGHSYTCTLRICQNIWMCDIILHKWSFVDHQEPTTLVEFPKTLTGKENKLIPNVKYSQGCLLTYVCKVSLY